MKFAIFRCCTTPIFLEQYESSTNAVLKKLGVEIMDINDFNCCGYPLRNYNHKAYILSSARNLSLAERNGVNITTFCNGCFGTLKHVNKLMMEDSSLRNEINEILGKEGLIYKRGVDVRHILEIFYEDIGIERVKEKLVKTFRNLKIATHYGCRILRPRQVARFDNPDAPTKFDQLIEITGAESMAWPKKLKCCGAPMWGIDDELSMELTHTKIVNAGQSGADYLCVACSYCQLQFDRVQGRIIQQRGPGDRMPSILYTQLLGLALGIDADVLGIHRNELRISRILDFLS